MLLDFLLRLREAGVPASLGEMLSLVGALEKHVAFGRVEDFYHLGRAALVKDERLFDRYDRVFAACFGAGARPAPDADLAIPESWLRGAAERLLSEEDKRRIQELGGWEALLRELRKRLAEQGGSHQGGPYWVGSGGTSPFGNRGWHPAGLRIGQDGPGAGRAVKVWDRREFRNLDGDADLSRRNAKLALRRLRRFAREGAAEELDLDGTVAATARSGLLDVKLRPERRNAMKVLLFLDVGGSMDEHVVACEEIFAAAHAEFAHLDHFYFHNCLYETVWKDNRRRHAERTETWRILRGHGPDWRVVVVGDATMSPYELLAPGGSVEHYNAEPGALWLERLARAFPRIAWLNPQPRGQWGLDDSIGLVGELLGGRMYPLTLDGLDQAVQALKR